MIEAVVTGLTELDFNFFERLFVAGVQTGDSSKACATRTC